MIYIVVNSQLAWYEMLLPLKYLKMNIRKNLHGVITICTIVWSFLKVAYLLRLLTCVTSYHKFGNPWILGRYLPSQRILEFSFLSLGDQVIGCWSLNPVTLHLFSWTTDLTITILLVCHLNIGGLKSFLLLWVASEDQ